LNNPERFRGKREGRFLPAFSFSDQILLYGYCLHRAGIGGFLTIAGTTLVGSDNMSLTIILHFEDLRAEFLACGTTFT
jgi:hypothetical protein